MELKPGYKQKEVGVIPEDWTAVALEAVTTHIGDGLHGTPVYTRNADYYFINGNNLSHGKVIITPDTQAVDQKEFDRHQKPLSNRSILMSINGTIGNLGLFQGQPIVLGKSAAYLNIRTDVSKLYVYHVLQSSCVRQQFFDGLTGSTIGNLGLSAIRSTCIPLPLNDSEQTSIAKALGEVDDLLYSLDQLLIKKQSIKQAAMQDLLNGKRRLPGFEGEWEVKRLGDVVQIRKGQLITSDAVLPGDIPVIAGGRQPAYYHAAANRNGRTITISASGASAGFVALYDEPIFASDCSTISEAESYCIDFLFYQLLSKQKTIYKAQTGGAQPHIHAKDLNPLLFSFPTLSEQSAIAAVLSDMDAELAALEARRDKVHELKQGMMQQLLTGKIRLT